MDGDFYRQRTEHAPLKCFKCGPVDHLIVKIPKPPKDNNKRLKNVRFKKRGNCASEENPITVMIITIKR